MRDNHSAFHRIWFRPKVLVNVEKIDYSTTMLGAKCSIPFYVTATALGKLGHPEGEVILTRGAGLHKVIQMVRFTIFGFTLGSANKPDDKDTHSSFMFFRRNC